jgi:hypothetical protein
MKRNGSGAVPMISPSVQACLIYYKSTRAKSQRLYLERKSASQWLFCGAVVDQGLAVGASQRSVKQQAMRAVSGFLYKE